uniref:C2H2-type domain-containing protein n=1 Tax=Timema monikensis TaxID=170555 RepID=A0A7R9HS56_9NEOP|nr:unnamed protein product [Timema monikensis]
MTPRQLIEPWPFSSICDNLYTDVYLVLILAEQGGQRTSDPPGARCVTNSYRHSEIHGEDDFDHTFSSKCSLVMPTEDIKLKVEKSFDNNDLENTEGSFDEPPMNIFNSHHMNLSGVNVDIESHSGPDATKDHKKLHRSKNPKIFTCEECHKQFSRHSGLRIHLLIHKGEKPYKCEDCGKYFRDRTSLRRHRQRIHHDAINNYVCPNCNKVYFERSVFLKHMEKESGMKRFHCKECNKSYTEMSSYRRHTRLHGGKKPFKCDLCNRRFTAICNVRQHMLTQHSSVLPFQCPECDKSFPRKYLFKKHVEEHSSKILLAAPCKIPVIHDQVDGEYNYDKQYVQASYTDTPGMDVSYTHNSQELFMHKGSINTPFSMTNKSYSNYENIQQLAQENTERSLDESLVNMSSHQMNLNVVRSHIENDSGSATTNMPKTKHNPIKPKIFICEECHRQFSRLAGLKTHLLIHKGEKPCKCKDCGRNFRDKTILRRHRQRIHHDTTVSYKCPNCDKIFFEKSYLLRHLQNESGEKRFHCKECNKGYTEMSSYRRHVRLHGGNKPFKCDLCNKRFTAICNVRQHKLTQHSRVYPFKCPECGKRFSRKFLLKKHVEKHSSEIVILLD